MTTPAPPARRLARFLLSAAALLLVYAVVVPIIWSNQSIVGDSGPLSRTQPAATEAPAGANVTVTSVERQCKELSGLGTPDRIKVVAGLIDGNPYYACYGYRDTGSISGAAVLDRDGIQVHDTALIKRSGAWRWIGTVKTPTETVLGGVAMVAIPAFAFLYYRRQRPGPEGGGWWQSRLGDTICGFLGPIGWGLIALDKRRSGARKIRLIMMSVLGFISVVLLGLLATVSEYPDGLGFAVGGLLLAQQLTSLALGRFQLAPAGFGATALAVAPQGYAPPGYPPQTYPPQGYQPAYTPPTSPPPSYAPAPAPRTAQPSDDASPLVVRQPAELPTFAQVGGMDSVKQELLDTVGLLLAFGDEAETYKLTFNGILLHGAPGTGKTFFAQAAAGELGLRYLRVSVSDLVSKWMGESAANIQRAFATAAANVPCILFFDEFDSVAGRRDDDPNDENRRVVNQLLTSLEQYRPLRELVVMAATNDVDKLDPAVIRPGRFDRRIRIDLPDEAARLSILTAQLVGRPLAPDLDVTEVAERTEGLSGAALAALVTSASLAAFRETAATGVQVPIGSAHLLGALSARGGKDRPTVEKWSWDRLVLDPESKAELQQIQELIEDPAAAEAYGIEAPSGLLLTGPPGTGKTTIARVFAAEAKCSFYAITVGDLTSKWVGESEDNVTRLFERARENAPSIIFLDEIDAIAPTRGEGGGWGDQLLNQLLAEIDGLQASGRVFVIGATNRADVIDPAMTRGGRLSRTMEIGLPDVADRRQLLGMFSARMPLYGVDLDEIAEATNGLAGADLEALCQQAAVAAMTRGRQKKTTQPRVTKADFVSALDTVFQSKRAETGPGTDPFLDSLTRTPGG